MKSWLPYLSLFFLALFPLNAAAKSVQLSGDPQSFLSLKDLVGTWTTTTEMEGKTTTGKLTYRSTSGGSALEETLFSGSPHEMVSMYTVDQGKVLMTHYCMLRNQPRLQEVSSSKNQIKLEQRDMTGAKSPDEAHMGGLTITIQDKDHFQQDWVHFGKDGKTETVTFQWTREK